MEEEQQVESTEETPVAEPQNTEEKVSENMIPQSRFNEINTKLREANERLAEIEKQNTDLERSKLEEKEEYKKLYEQQLEEVNTAKSEAATLKLQMLKSSIASKLKLPEVLVDRLQGNTEEEIEADAKSLLKSLPKPSAPNTNNVEVNAPNKAQVDEERKRQLAAEFGINPSYIQ